MKDSLSHNQYTFYVPNAKESLQVIYVKYSFKTDDAEYVGLCSLLVEGNLESSKDLKEFLDSESSAMMESVEHLNQLINLIELYQADVLKSNELFDDNPVDMLINLVEHWCSGV